MASAGARTDRTASPWRGWAPTEALYLTVVGAPFGSHPRTLQRTVPPTDWTFSHQTVRLSFRRKRWFRGTTNTVPEQN